MIHFPKSFPGPKCLINEKRKGKKCKHDCPGVLKRLLSEFHEKCYLCERHIKESPRIEHFYPQSKYPELRCEWKNLYLACDYCNGIKSDNYIPLLDCTDPSIDILQKIKIELLVGKSFPKESGQTIMVSSLENTPETINTVELLEEIYSGKNSSRRTENRDYVRGKLLNEITQELVQFRSLIIKYKKDRTTFYRKQVQSAIKNSSPFAGFKYWMIKGHPDLVEDFI